MAVNGAVAFGVLTALLAGAPFVLGAYYATLVIPIVGYSIALLGLNLLFGYGGLLSFGHAMFMAIGAYSSAVLGTKLGVRSFEVQLMVAVFTSAAVAAAIGLLCLRYATIFFSMLTLAFGMIFHSFLFKLYDLTGGESGISVARPTLLGGSFAQMSKTTFLIGPFYWYSLALLVVMFALMALIVASPFGLALQAARDNPRKTEFLGVAIFKVRYVAFVISAVYCAVGGAVLAVSVGAADPELAFWTQSGNMIFIIVLGGLGQLLGPIVGSLSFTLLQDTLMANTQYWRFALGAALALIIVFAPRGLIGMAMRAFGYLQEGWKRVARPKMGEREIPEREILERKTLERKILEREILERSR
jgi:branched-chain amino acid transport system permease protein